VDEAGTRLLRFWPGHDEVWGHLAGSSALVRFACPNKNGRRWKKFSVLFVTVINNPVNRGGSVTITTKQPTFFNERRAAMPQNSSMVERKRCYLAALRTIQKISRAVSAPLPACAAFVRRHRPKWSGNPRTPPALAADGRAVPGSGEGALRNWYLQAGSSPQPFRGTPNAVPSQYLLLHRIFPFSGKVRGKYSFPAWRIWTAP
jgi:hypothetical protein